MWAHLCQCKLPTFSCMHQVLSCAVSCQIELLTFVFISVDMAPSRFQCATPASDVVQPAHNIPNGPPPATPMGPPVQQWPAPHQSTAEGRHASATEIDDATMCYPAMWCFVEFQPSAIHMKDSCGHNTVVLHQQAADIMAGAFQNCGSHLALVHRTDTSPNICTRGAYQYWNSGKGKTAFAEVGAEQRLNTQGCMTSSCMYRKGKGVAKGRPMPMPRPGPYDHPSGNNDQTEEEDGPVPRRP